MYKIVRQSQKKYARIGEIATNHGVLKTPIFMPPATLAAVKSLSSQDLEDIEAEIILVNALHLHLRPGEEIIRYLGGIHNFMAFKKPILSDSGGFQAWSFNKKRSRLSKIKDDGVEFVSPWDGSKHFITPEKAIEIEHTIGTDIIMAFDECSPDNDDKIYTKKAMERTHLWAIRSLKAHQLLTQQKLAEGQSSPLIFGIIQGGSFLDLRKESAKFISSLPFDGFALGGETIGYNMQKTLEIIEEIKPLLPVDKPLYTMGLGSNPNDIIEVVKRGVDMFDCVNPARIARHGDLYQGKIIINAFGIEIEAKDKKIINISNSQYKRDSSPIDEDCDCYTCQNFSRAYLHHLYLNKEPLYLRLATIHNLRYMLRIIHALRENIINDTT